MQETHDQVKLANTSTSFVAELSVRSPQKIFFSLSKKKNFWVKVSAKTIYLIFKTEALANTEAIAASVAVLAEIPLRSPRKIFIFIIKN